MDIIHKYSDMYIPIYHGNNAWSSLLSGYPWPFSLMVGPAIHCIGLYSHVHLFISSQFAECECFSLSRSVCFMSLLHVVYLRVNENRYGNLWSHQCNKLVNKLNRQFQWHTIQLPDDIYIYIHILISYWNPIHIPFIFPQITISMGNSGS